jgi:cytochrome c biogenesis protein CcmG/thiol:disulfide interchange protein DsbE
VLIDTKAPEFSLPDLFDPEKTVDSASMQGKVWLLNVWGTWCAECWREHEYLIHLGKNEGIPIVGIDWRDDAEAARQFLQRKGNPFVAVGIDPESTAIMNFGVYGAPETFLIDKQGYIRLKHTGAMSPEIWHGIFKPKIQELEKTQ